MAEQHVGSSKVVVGVDGSNHSRAALEWAAAEAARSGAELRVVHALGMPLVVSTQSGPGRFQPTEEISDQATDVLKSAAARARELQPTVSVKTVTALEEAPLAILRQSGKYDLIVIGTRGLGTIAAMFVGSVSIRVAAQAPCPVVVVPSDEEGRPATTALNRVVVGVDSSDNARGAFGLALDLASENNGELVLVHSWDVPYPYDPVAMTAAGYQPQQAIFEQKSDELVSELLDEVTEGDNVDVSVVRTQTGPVDALLKAAEGADAIVVGSRGRGTVRGLLLGSVSQGVLHRAKIPVVVLPKHAGEED